ncbi:type II toxin-antitoxin system HicB family antitoxin [Mesorhizobium salmacidum]|uniref:type II toxin-antitoxin system HicB family antitoxin n=1 Tax=Mesorhizobium salmacidum TaxID=3015171 RepID=UPI0039F5ED36
MSFPGFPGVVTAAISLDEAVVIAEEALAFHVEGLFQHGEAIPEPSSIEQVLAGGYRGAFTTIAVQLKIGR